MAVMLASDNEGKEMKRKAIWLVPVALIAAVVTGAVGTLHHGPRASRSLNGAVRAAALAMAPVTSPSPMITLPCTELRVTENHAGVGWTLGPPPLGVQPGVIAD